MRALGLPLTCSALAHALWAYLTPELLPALLHHDVRHAGAMRSVVAAQSKSRKAEEARQLKKENAAHRKSLSNVHAKTDDGDGIQF